MKTGLVLRCGAVLLVLGAASAGTAADLELAARGRNPKFTIVVPKAASPSVRYAAEELRDFTAQATGVKLAIVDDAAPLPKAAILVGETARTAEVLGRPAGGSDLGTDGFRLAARPPHLVVEGSSVRGALYGVYELLERFLGCRWYASWHTVVPRVEVFTVPADLDVVEKPAFVSREPFWFDVLKHGEFGARLRANNRSWNPLEAKYGGDAFRFGKGLGSCHTLEGLVPADEFYDAHPEYFALVSGRRLRKRMQLCLTNPDVLRIVTERVLKLIRQDPDAHVYGVSQADCFNWCTCPACAAVDEAEGSHAGTNIRFVNAVAEAVAREFPGKRIETLAYGHTRRPPKLTRPRSNVTVCLCSIECDFARPLATPDSPDNRPFVEDLRGWGKLTDNLYLWNYTTDFPDFPAPFPNVYCLQDDIRLFRDNGVAYLFEQGGCNGRHAGFAELKAWLLAKLMWNPDRPIQPLLDDFFGGYFGAAAPYARQFFERVHELQRARTAPLKCFEEVENGGLADETWEEGAILWRKAEEAVKDDPVRSYNVRMASFSCDYMRVRRFLADEWKTLRFVSEDPARTARRPEMRRVARSLLARLDEAKDICVAEDWKRGEKIVAEWRRFVAETNDVAHGVSSSGIVRASDFDLRNEGEWCVRVDDPAALGGKAVKMTNTHGEWCVFFAMRNAAFEPGRKYRLRAHVRVQKKPGVRGRLFWLGVYDYAMNVGRADFDVDAERVGDGYAWYDVLTWSPASGDRFFIAPGRKADEVRANVEGVWIDAVEFTPCP